MGAWAKYRAELKRQGGIFRKRDDVSAAAGRLAANPRDEAAAMELLKQCGGDEREAQKALDVEETRRVNESRASGHTSDGSE